MNDPYAVLGLSPSASDEEVKRAYRALVKKYHPDNYVNNPLADLAEAKMKEINEAYDAIVKGRTQGGYQQQAQSNGNRYGTGGQAGQNPAFLQVRQLIVQNNLAEAERILRQIRDNGLTVQAVVLTHAHADHMLAAEAVCAATGAPLWLAAAERAGGKAGSVCRDGGVAQFGGRSGSAATVCGAPPPGAAQDHHRTGRHPNREKG